MTLHNVPEGLTIGMAVGAALSSDTMVAALTLALGIGIQNFPEGTAIALPLRHNGFSVRRSFFFGQISSFVKTISAVCSAVLTVVCNALLPYALIFAAGAMIYVVFAEINPEAYANGNKNPSPPYLCWTLA